MKRLTTIVVSLAIIILCIAGYFIYSQFTPENTAEIGLSPTITQAPSVSLSQTQIATSLQTPSCQKNQLSANISSQGAAGNVYTKLDITNVGKTSCDIVLGDTVTLQLYGDNIIKHYQQTVPTQHFTLAPTQKVYSQIHYPNGPQCQSGITQKQTSLLYFIPQTSTEIDFTDQNDTLNIPICNSQSEITTIDIWPLSKSSITP